LRELLKSCDSCFLEATDRGWSHRLDVLAGDHTTNPANNWTQRVGIGRPVMEGRLWHQVTELWLAVRAFRNRWREEET